MPGFNMVQGIGCDIIEIGRIRASIARHGQHFLDRIYTPLEQEYCLKHRDPAPHFAARFAAKEAIVKALGTGFRNGISWQDIEIRKDANGKPTVHLSSKLSALQNSPQLMISISHCREYAVAHAVYL